MPAFLSVRFFLEFEAFYLDELKYTPSKLIRKRFQERLAAGNKIVRPSPIFGAVDSLGSSNKLRVALVRLRFRSAELGPPQTCYHNRFLWNEMKGNLSILETTAKL